MKKVYQKPEIDVVTIEYTQMLAGSDIKGSSGVNFDDGYQEDIPVDL